MSKVAMKYRAQNKPGTVYRLTLSATAFGLAVQKSKAISGYVAYPRLDGQWDVMVAMGTASQLQQQRLDGEHLSDVVERLLKMTMTKTIISLTGNNGEMHNITLNYDDATIEAITDAAVELIRRYRLSAGSSLVVCNIEEED